MDNSFSTEQAKEILEEGMNEAESLIKTEPEKVSGLLAELEAKLKDIPVVGTALSDVPLMIQMIRSYIKKEYTDVSPKVIVSMVSALLYLIKKKDLIPDNIPVVGLVDDIAVIALALKFVEPELRAFSEWRGTQQA